MVMRLRRLEDLLGGRLDRLQYKDVADLVGNPDAAESEDLDYKQAHYSTEDQGKEELAKDIAAFANHLGGVLIIGIAETKGVPSKVFDVDLDDRLLRHIRQVVANNTAPPVPYQAIRLPNPENPSVGFLLLAVPRSPQAPHAVTAPPTKRTKDALRYPRRSGSQTDWLTETVVATAYRARYAAAAKRDQRAEDVESDIVHAIRRRSIPHLIVTVVPEVPGDMVINGESFARYSTELRATVLHLGQGHRTLGSITVGERRLVCSEGSDGYSRRAELHRDGSATLAWPLAGNTSFPNQPSSFYFVEPGEVVYAALCSLAFLAGHARDRTGATGTALVNGTLVNSLVSHPAVNPVLALEQTAKPLPLRIDRVDRGNGQRVPTSTQACASTSTAVTVVLDDIADQGRGLLQAVALVSNELVQAFGLPETGLISTAGELNADLFTDRNRGAVADWARSLGLL
ncbi:helix-turn-helix domain-containing protein [Streptomyces sp. NRRL S-337]|uniref:AlbA family DNA-binding domain-containing protein n=1 Tax=Streptomyces sp. NRRL S-337 TaxID=1463900 RepID=UPI0004C6DB7C|nr:ATP-binding protein [Streptomyces sp. NRRL S-337]